MEVLVARQPEKTAIPLALIAHAGKGQVAAPAQQGRAVAMFKSTVSLADRRGQKQITVKRCPLGDRLEKRRLSGTQRCEIPGQPFQIDIASTGDRDLVFGATGLK